MVPNPAAESPFRVKESIPVSYLFKDVSHITRKPVFGVSDQRSNTNWAVQPQEMASGLKIGLKFRI